MKVSLSSVEYNLSESFHKKLKTIVTDNNLNQTEIADLQKFIKSDDDQNIIEQLQRFTENLDLKFYDEDYEEPVEFNFNVSSLENSYSENIDPEDFYDDGESASDFSFNLNHQDDVFNSVKYILKSSLIDSLVTTNDEVDKVSAFLGELDESEYSSVINKLDDEGILSLYISNLEDSSRQESFIEQARAKGYLDKDLSVNEGYPKEPDIIENKSSYPYSVRKLLHTHNINEAKAYTTEYKNYINDYLDKILKAENGADLRNLGKPELPFTNSLSESLSKNSRGLSSDELDSWQKDFFPLIADLELYSTKPYDKLLNKQYEILKLTRPGTIDIGLSIQKGKSLEGLALSSKRELSLSSSNGGDFKTNKTTEFSVDDKLFGDSDSESPLNASFKTELTDDDKAETSVELELDAGIIAGTQFKNTEEGIELSEAKLGAGISGNTLSASVSKDKYNTSVGKRETYKISLDGSLGINEANSVSYGTSFNGQTFSQKAAINTQIAKAEAYVKFTGLTIEEIEHLLSDNQGFFDVPEELKQKPPVNWESLSEKRQAELLFDLWTPEEWNNKISN